MAQAISPEAMDQLFLKARTHIAWQDRAVEDELLRRVYDLAKWGPTSANTTPMRVVFVKSHAGKEQLRPALSPGNVAKTMAAPVCAIVANDTRFYEFAPRLFPASPKFGEMFTQPGKEEFTKMHIMRNGSLQGAYLIMAARALGLDCGPMSGFDNAKLDAAFFPDGRWQSNFLCNMGYGDEGKLHPRGPRLGFEEACQIV